MPTQDPHATEEQVIPLRELERRAILQAVADAGRDKLLAARRLGIGKTTLYRKLKEYATSPAESDGLGSIRPGLDSGRTP